MASGGCEDGGDPVALGVYLWLSVWNDACGEFELLSRGLDVK